MNVPYSHAFLDICRTDSLPQIDDELCDLLDIDDIFVLLGVLLISNDLGTSRHL